MRRDQRPSIIIAITAGAGIAEPGESQRAPDRVNSQRLPASEKALRVRALRVSGFGSAPNANHRTASLNLDKVEPLVWDPIILKVTL